MLSYHAMGLSQDGQRERGWMTDSSRGSRYTHTLRKLPSSDPKMPVKTISTGSARSTRQLVEEDASRDAGVERLGASPHRDRDPHVIQGAPRVPHPMPLAADYQGDIVGRRLHQLIHRLAVGGRHPQREIEDAAELRLFRSPIGQARS